MGCTNYYTDTLTRREGKVRILKSKRSSCKMAVRLVDLVGMLHCSNWQHEGCRTVGVINYYILILKQSKKFLEYGGPMKLFWAFSMVTMFQYKVNCLNFVWFLKNLVLFDICVDKTCHLLQMSDILLVTYYNHFTTYAIRGVAVCLLSACCSSGFAFKYFKK